MGAQTPGHWLSMPVRRRLEPRPSSPTACCRRPKQFPCGRSLVRSCPRPPLESICCQPARPRRSRARGSPHGRPFSRCAPVGVGRDPVCSSRSGKRALERLHRELMELNPSAARSLEEGMEETLTVHRLRMPAQLRRTLATTNVIESAFSIVETVCRNVKRWRAGDHIERWVGSGLLVAERQFRKVQGYREIPALLTALANVLSKKAVAEEVKVA